MKMKLMTGEVLPEKFLKDFDLKLPLNVRDSFYGGRTEPFMLHYKCKENEQIKYYDITSLYPCVQKYEKFPIGHPKIIIKNFNDFWGYFGFAKLSIIPPRKLYVSSFIICSSQFLIDLRGWRVNESIRDFIESIESKQISKKTPYDTWKEDNSTCDEWKYYKHFVRGQRMKSTTELKCPERNCYQKLFFIILISDPAKFCCVFTPTSRPASKA